MGLIINRLNHWRPVVLLCLSVLLVACPRPAAAQFIGFTSPQTTQELLLDAVTATGTSDNVRNLGQSVHYLTYTTAGTVTQLSIQMEGCNGPADTTCAPGGAGFIRISETATDTTVGALFASGYFTLVRANITVLAGGGSVTAEYSGTSVATGPPVGVFNTSGIFTKTLVLDDDADTTSVFNVELPRGGTSGFIVFNYDAVGPAGSTMTVSAGPDTSHLGIVLDSWELNANAGTVFILVPAFTANVARVTYSTGGASAATYDLFYTFFGNSQSTSILLPGSSDTTSNPPEALFRCDKQININLSASGNTQVLAALAGLTRRICHVSFSFASAVDFSITEGTGTDCATSNNPLTGTYQEVTSITLDFGPFGTLDNEAGGRATCINLGAAVVGGGVIIFAEF